MVVHYVEHYPYSGFVQGLDHFLEFPDAARRIVGFSGVGAVGDIVVHWVIAPVVDIVLQSGLVDRGIVEGWKDVYVRHAQLDEMVNAGAYSAGPVRACLGQSEEFATVLRGNAGIGRDREIPVVHFVDHSICKGPELRAVPGPAFGVGAAEIHYCRPLPVGSDCGGENTGSLLEPPA